MMNKTLAFGYTPNPSDSKSTQDDNRHGLVYHAYNDRKVSFAETPIESYAPS